MEGKEEREVREEVRQKIIAQSSVEGALRELLDSQQKVFREMMLAQNVNVQVHRSENADSIEMGSQKDGRVKVYGDFSKKTEFAAKIKDAIEVLVAAQTAMPKQNGGD